MRGEKRRRVLIPEGTQADGWWGMLGKVSGLLGKERSPAVGKRKLLTIPQPVRIRQTSCSMLCPNCNIELELRMDVEVGRSYAQAVKEEMQTGMRVEKKILDPDPTRIFKFQKSGSELGQADRVVLKPKPKRFSAREKAKWVRVAQPKPKGFRVRFPPVTRTKVAIREPISTEVAMVSPSESSLSDDEPFTEGPRETSLATLALQVEEEQRWGEIAVVDPKVADFAQPDDGILPACQLVATSPPVVPDQINEADDRMVMCLNSEGVLVQGGESGKTL